MPHCGLGRLISPVFLIGGNAKGFALSFPEAGGRHPLSTSQRSDKRKGVKETIFCYEMAMAEGDIKAIQRSLAEGYRFDLGVIDIEAKTIAEMTTAKSTPSAVDIYSEPKATSKLR
jgi:hypothetical protein